MIYVSRIQDIINLFEELQEIVINNLIYSPLSVFCEIYTRSFNFSDIE